MVDRSKHVDKPQQVSLAVFNLQKLPGSYQENELLVICNHQHTHSHIHTHACMHAHKHKHTHTNTQVLCLCIV